MVSCHCRNDHRIRHRHGDVSTMALSLLSCHILTPPIRVCSYEGFEEQDEVPVLYLALPEGAEEEAVKDEPKKKDDPQKKDEPQKKEEHKKKDEPKASVDAAKGASLDDDWGASGGGASLDEVMDEEVEGSKGFVVGFMVTLSEFTVEEFNEEFQVHRHHFIPPPHTPYDLALQLVIHTQK